MFKRERLHSGFFPVFCVEVLFLKFRGTAVSTAMPLFLGITVQEVFYERKDRLLQGRI